MAVEIGEAGPVLILFTYAFVTHIVLVNFDIGLGMIIPFMKRHGEKTNQHFYLDWARRYMRYLAIVYASAGVFATAFTVFLLTFYPPLIPLISEFLFWPYALAMVFLGLRLISISSYWYTWDRMSPKNHFRIGLLLASTSFLVPFTLRLPMAFFNIPTGVISVNPPRVDLLQLFLLNPTFWPLYIKSILGAFVITCFILAAVHSFYYYSTREDRESAAYVIKLYLVLGGAALLLLLPVGIWYLLIIGLESSFKFNNLIGSILGGNPQGVDVSPLLILKGIIVVIQGNIALYFLWKLIVRSEDFPIDEYRVRRLIYILAFLGPLGIIVGEVMNGFSQFPYLIAQPDLVAQIPEIDTNTILNPVAAVFDIYVISIFALVPLFLAFLVLLYYLVSGKVVDRPT